MIDTQRDYYFVFFNIGGGWLDHFVLPRTTIRHVSLIWRGELGWYTINPAHDHIDFREIWLLPEQDFESKFALIKHCVCYVHVEIGQKIHYKSPIMFASCVNIAKRITGIDVGFSLTPCIFYKQLIKCDGKTNFKTKNVRWFNGFSPR